MARISFSIQDGDKAAKIIRDAGGRVVGRTKLQKIAYLLEAVNLGEGFAFEYRHYGPYSEQLSEAVSIAALFKKIHEQTQGTDWGGSYSIYTTSLPMDESTDSSRLELIRRAAQADSVALELAATAVFLAKNGESSPWEETVRRKPEKKDRIELAKALYKQLQQVQTPVPFPIILNEKADQTITASR